MEVTLRRCNFTLVTSFLFTVLVLVVVSGSANAKVLEVKDEVFDNWPHTLYYVAHLESPSKPYDTVDVYITAIDNFTLYINGELIGSDSDNDWSTVEVFENIPLGGTDYILVGVAVENEGKGTGNGLMVDIKAGSDWMGTSTLKRRAGMFQGVRTVFPVTWYYYYGTEDEFDTLVGSDWYTMGGVDSRTGLTFLGDANKLAEMTQVVLGDIGDLDFNPDPNIEIVTGYPGNVDMGSIVDGGIRLRRIEGENLAEGKPSEQEQLTDGDVNSGYQYNQDPLNSTRQVDLERQYRINKMIIYTGKDNPEEWDERSVRGYSVEISLDEFRWRK